MIRFITFYLLWLCLLMSPPCSAQTPRINCTVSACTIVADPFPITGVRPAQCRLYASLAGQPEVAILTANVVGGTSVDPTAPPSSVACWLPSKFTVGTWAITATALDGVGSEGPHSSPYNFESYAPAPPAPNNLRPKTGTVFLP